MSHLAVRPPENMTGRAQVYLFAGGARHLSIGIVILIFPQLMASAAFVPIINFFPLWVWGSISLVAGTICTLGWILRDRATARTGLIMSAAVTGLMATGIWLGLIAVWRDGGAVAPISAILLTTLVIKDLSVCTNPMKTPFESVNMMDRLKTLWAGGKLP